MADLKILLWIHPVLWSDVILINTDMHFSTEWCYCPVRIACIVRLMLQSNSGPWYKESLLSTVEHPSVFFKAPSKTCTQRENFASILLGIVNWWCALPHLIILWKSLRKKGVNNAGSRYFSIMYTNDTSVHLT